MNPFAYQLRQTRAARNLPQKDFSQRMGYRQSYISAVECGNKLPKNVLFVDHIVTVLRLTATEADELRKAYQQSLPRDFPPQGTPRFAYRACSRFSELLPTLTQAEAKIVDDLFDFLEQCRLRSNAVGAACESEFS